MANKSPTKEQLEVIDYGDGNLQVIACAGSGKTTTISKRIAKLIESGSKPESIVAFTFTEKAAEVMKFKVRTFIGIDDKTPGELGDMYVGTIHSFCFELLKKYKPEFASYEVLDDVTRIIFFEKHYYNLGLKESSLWNYNFWSTISNLIKNIDIVREEMIDPSKLSNEDFKKIIGKYDDLLNEYKYLDFSSMMALTVKMLEEDNKIVSDIQSKIKYLFCDEYQDINPVQEKLIKLLTNKKNVCVVGDDDQSIYQWRGTKVDNILTFSKRYDKVKQTSLVKNFRSTEGIIKHSNSLIRNNEKNRLTKEMIADKDNRKYENGDIYSVFFNRQDDELDFIIKRLRSLYGTRFVEGETERALDWRDFAIFFRSVKLHAKPYIERLKKEKIPFIVKGSVGLFDREEVWFIITSLAYVLEPEYDRVETKVNTKENKDIYSRIFESKFPSFEDFIKKLDKIKLAFHDKKNINLQNVFQKTLNAIGLGEFQIKEEILYNIGQISMIISDYESQHFPIKNSPKQIGYFFRFLIESASGFYDEGGNEERFGGVNAVQIMTMHRCKGLEFPVIFIPALTKQAYPKKGRDNTKWFISDKELPSKLNYLTTEESQRRLLYVAITRSMKFLFITYSRRMDQYERDQNPCEYVSELADDFILRKGSEDPTKREKSSNFVPSSNEMFPTNISEMSYYFDCPHDFKLRHVFGFNPTLDPLIGYGKSIHNIINHIHKDIQRGIPIDVEKITDGNFILRYAGPDTNENGRKNAKIIVENYMKHFKDDVQLSLETEKPFELCLGNALISGRIDLIRKKTAIGEDIIIIDFKTEKEPDTYREQKHRDQVILYGLAYEKAYNKKPENVFVHFLDKGEEKEPRKEIKITSVEINRVTDKINKGVESIRKKNFPQRPYAPTRCKECDFKLICSEGCRNA